MRYSTGHQRDPVQHARDEQGIKAKADEIGSEAFALVRRGINGESNCFYAMEGGRVVGHPFNLPGLSGNIASLVLQFGCRHMV